MPDQKKSSTNRQLSTKNFILRSLPPENYERLLPDLKPVRLVAGKIIYRPEETIEYVYFPDSAIISVVANTLSGQSAEAGVIGWEGMSGIDLLMGSDFTLNENIIQLPGDAYQIKAEIIKREFDRGGDFNRLVLGYIRLMILQISQTALCNRLHSVKERLARWLLMCHDRAGVDVLPLTQEFLSIMLGTNRAAVTMAAITLRKTGYIKYSRGLISIKDRAGLEDFSCECYKIIKKEDDRRLIKSQTSERIHSVRRPTNLNIRSIS